MQRGHFHVHVRPGRKGKGGDHAQYIAREGRFKAEKYGEIGEHEVGNLPEWARGSAARFFATADDHERSNGNSYREFELALPKELSDAERGRLVRELVAEQLGSGHAYSWAIHEPKGHNPHVHIMFSERIIDGIERGPEQYFKRANTKKPERGGHLKSDRFTGRGGPEAIEALRVRWEEMQNQALERAGLDVRVDHRSLKAQGIKREAGQHRGPAVSGVEARGKVADVSVRREAERVERAQARAAVGAEMRVVSRDEIALERVAVRERRELALEVSGEDRALVLPLIEADRREQLGRVEAQAERRVERRQGLKLGSELKEKLLTQARGLRERLGRELGRVKDWVRKRFAEPLERLKDHTRDLVGTVVEKARPTSEQIRAQGREQWLAMRAEAQAKEQGAGEEKTSGQSLEEQRLQAVKDWLAYRAMTPEQRQAWERERQQERGSQKSERSTGRDGADFE